MPSSTPTPTESQPNGAPRSRLRFITLQTRRRFRPNRKLGFQIGSTHPQNLSGSSGEEGPMERCITKSVEKCGEEAPVERRTTKGLKAGAAIGPHGLFGGYYAKGKPDDEEAVPALKGTMASVATAAAAVAAVAAAEAAKHAASAAAFAKQAEEASAAAFAKQAEEASAAPLAKQAEEAAAAAATKQAEADDDDDVATATGTEDEEASQIWATESEEEEEVPQMSAIEFLMTYKELPQFEVGLILRKPWNRTPFTDTQEYKDLLADPSVTQEDMDEAAAVHEAWQEHRLRFQEYVRSEYEAKGYVEVSEEYIAKRIEIEEYSKKLWEEGFADFDKDEVTQ